MSFRNLCLGSSWWFHPENKQDNHSRHRWEWQWLLFPVLYPPCYSGKWWRNKQRESWLRRRGQGSRNCYWEYYHRRSSCRFWSCNWRWRYCISHWCCWSIWKWNWSEIPHIGCDRYWWWSSRLDLGWTMK